jgi:phosphatidylglycerophosphatase A
MTHKLARWIATCGPVGHLKFAPGTVGSLCGVLPVLLYQNNSVFSFLLAGSLFLISVWASSVAAKDLGDKDPSVVVIDEVCGIMVTFLFIPLSGVHLLIGFFAFRACDIIKPQPVRYLERLPNGFGIVLDDVMAGIYANVVLQLLIRYAHV